MTDKQQEKYVNMLLAELYERALNYSKKAFSTSARISGRERSANRVLAEELCKVYNIAIGLIGPLGTSDIAKSQKIVWSRQFREDFEMLDEAGIEEIVYEAYKASGQERQSVRTKEYKRTIDYLNQHPQLAAEILNAVDSVAKSTSRLNAKRGGLVRHYMHDLGLSAQEARARAQEVLDNEEIMERAKHLASEGIGNLDNSSNDAFGIGGDVVIKRQDTTSSSILDLLGPARGEADANLSVERDSNVIDDSNNDSGSSNDFSVFDTEDQVLEASQADDSAISESNKTSTLAKQQLKAMGTAQEVAARALLEQAGVKPKKGIK